VVEALPHESLHLVADLVEQVPAVDPYTLLKGRLLSAHQLMDFQRAEALFDMSALGGRKLSQQMAAMLEVCPRGAEKCILFPCLFLCRLPRQLRVLLTQADLADIKGLAEQADELWTHHSVEDLVAAFQQPLLEEEPTAAVAAVHGPPSQGGKATHWKKKEGRKPPLRSRPSPKRLVWWLGSAWPTLVIAMLPTAATPRVHGWEAEGPGACQRRHSWSSFPPHRQHFTLALSSQYQCGLLQFSAQLYSSSNGSVPSWTIRASRLLLG
jgi:hypothetical protein